MWDDVLKPSQFGRQRIFHIHCPNSDSAYPTPNQFNSTIFFKIISYTHTHVFRRQVHWATFAVKWMFLKDFCQYLGQFWRNKIAFVLLFQKFLVSSDHARWCYVLGCEKAVLSFKAERCIILIADFCIKIQNLGLCSSCHFTQFCSLIIYYFGDIRDLYHISVI